MTTALPSVATMFLAALAPQNQPNVRLKAGEAASVAFSEEGVARLASITLDAAVPSVIESRAKELASTPAAQVTETLTKEPVGVPMYVKAGTVRFSFVRLSDRPGMLLLVENGLDRRLHYKAVAHEGQSQAPTSVCDVIAKSFGIEAWQSAMDSLDLSGFNLADETSTSPACE